jgi:general secretion pathway protein L
MIKKTQSVITPATERLPQMCRRLWQILSFSPANERVAPKRCLSINIDRGGIDVAFGSRLLSRLKIKGTIRYELEDGRYPSPEILATSVKRAIIELNALPEEVTLIAPKAWIIVKIADFPLVVKGNLPEVISYELDRLIPLSPEKAYYDYQVIREESDRLYVLLAALRADTLDPYLQALMQRGIQVRRVAASFSALDALRHRVEEGEPGIFLNIQPEGDKFLSTAVGGVIEDLQPGGMRLNLLDKGVHKAVRTPVALTIVLLMALGAVGLFALSASLKMETKKVEALEQAIALRSKEVIPIEALQKERFTLEKEIEAIYHFKTAHPMAVNLLKEMTLILPVNAWLNRIHITDSTIDIEGYAASATDILPRFEASQYFKKVEFTSPTYRDLRINADRFAVRMEIEGLSEENVNNENKQ